MSTISNHSIFYKEIAKKTQKFWLEKVHRCYILKKIPKALLWVSSDIIRKKL